MADLSSTRPVVQSGAPFIRLGSRGSPLALAQAHEARARLAAAWDVAAETIEIVVIKVSGDRILDRPLYDIGGKGLFTKEIEDALIDGRIDVAVHSLKDVPTIGPTGLEVAAVLERADARDALISAGGQGLEALPAGARIGTSSPRRRAQLAARRPDLVLEDLRGSVDTRLGKLAEGRVDATMLAMAGLNRLGRSMDMVHPLSPDEFLPAAAQGAIGLQIRADDARARAMIAPVNHDLSHTATLAERSVLEVLDGSCRTPIAAHGQIFDGHLRLRGLVCGRDGRTMIEDEVEGAASDSRRLGLELGGRLKQAAPLGLLI